MWRQLLGVWGSFPYSSTPSHHQGRKGKGRTGITKINGWRWLLAPQIMATWTWSHWMPSPALASLGTCCSAQSKCSSLAPEIQPGFLHRRPLDLPPTPSSLPQHPRAWGFIHVMSPCPCDCPVWRFSRQGVNWGFFSFQINVA